MVDGCFVARESRSAGNAYRAFVVEVGQHRNPLNPEVGRSPIANEFDGGACMTVSSRPRHDPKPKFRVIFVCSVQRDRPEERPADIVRNGKVRDVVPPGAKLQAHHEAQDEAG
jgi:hypothetical protein